jgi:8-amino-7-oxononanoate synthase
MATHSEQTIDSALDTFSQVKAAFESDHGPLPAPGLH